MSPQLKARFRALVAGPWGWFPLLTIWAGLTSLLLALAYSMARREVAGGEALYWVAFPLGVMPVAAILLRPYRARRERLALIVLLGIQMFLPFLLRSPTSFTGYDELLHFRSLADILRTGHLFHPNPLLTVSPYFPALEISTSSVAQLSGADPFAAAVVLLAFIRVLFATALFLLFEEVAGSSRLAGLAALIYILNPSFAFFDSRFAYETLALPLMPVILLVVARWARSGAPGWRPAPTLLLAVLLVTLTVTHHVTSYGMITLLVGWAILQPLLRRSRDRYSGSIAMVALVAVLGVGVWLFSVASLTLGYLVAPLGGAVRQMINLIATGEGRSLFQSATGQLAPEWERFAGLAASGFLLAWLPIGLGVIVRRMRHDSLAVLLALLALGYPASLVLRLTPTGSEAAGRSSAMIYFGLALVVALGVDAWRDLVAWIVQHLRLPWAVTARVWLMVSSTPPFRVLGVAAIGLLTLGGVIVGTTPATRLPGPYLVSADARSIDGESLAVARWARAELGSDRRIAADRVNRLLLGSYGEEHVVFHHSEGIESWQLFVTPVVGVNERNRLVRLTLEYILIDRRLSESLPLSGFYYEEGEIAHGRHTTPISPQVLGKWDGVTAVDRIFDSGDIQIYDVRRISGAP